MIYLKSAQSTVTSKYIHSNKKDITCTFVFKSTATITTLGQHNFEEISNYNCYDRWILGLWLELQYYYCIICKKILNMVKLPQESRLSEQFCEN